MVAGRKLLEESPSTAEQDAGEMPAEATSGRVQQRYTAASAVRVERRGKSSPTTWQLVRSVNPIRCKIS